MDPVGTFLCAIEDFRQFGLKGFFTAEFCRIPAAGRVDVRAKQAPINAAVSACGGGRPDSCPSRSILVLL